MVKSTGNVSKRFISTIYKTGGQFALRGWFTAEFFKKLGFDNPAVVGCPSLYQLGRNLKITKKKLTYLILNHPLTVNLTLLKII